ncbi:hypothetical protein B1218_37915, partial [Pseudomonas ogarae]
MTACLAFRGGRRGQTPGGAGLGGAARASARSHSDREASTGVPHEYDVHRGVGKGGLDQRHGARLREQKDGLGVRGGDKAVDRGGVARRVAWCMGVLRGQGGAGSLATGDVYGAKSENSTYLVDVAY